MMRMRFAARLAVLCLVMAFGIAAAANAGTLTGHVRNQSSAPIEGATVDVLTPSTTTVLASGTTDVDGAYTIAVADGTYDVRVTPPLSSGLGSSTAGVVVSGTTTLDFALVSSSGQAFSGRLLDAAGNGVPAQSLQLIREGGEIGQFATTDATGNFSFQVEPGSFFLVANGDNQSFTVQGPQFYSIQTDPFAVVGNEVVELRLPVKRVTVHVQDSAGNPIANAGIGTTNAFGCELQFGPATACGVSNYAFNPAAPANAVTDGSGNVTLFLFPTPSTAATSYTFTATPPAATGLAAGSLSGVAILADTTVTITLAPPTVLSGRLLDALGGGIPGQSVTLVLDGQETGLNASSDAAGGFSFAVQPGTYRLFLSGDNQDFTVAAPQFYTLNSGPFALSTSQAIDFQLPVRRVDVHVQDSAGAAVANVGLSTSLVNNCDLPLGPSVGGCGASNFTFSGPGAGAVTDANGNVTLWLFPTPPASPDPAVVTTYLFTATPPSGSGYASTNLSGVEVGDNTNITITLSAPIGVSGRLTDGMGNGIASQFLQFAPDGAGVAIDLITDEGGNYSVQLQPGAYRINALGDNQLFTAAAPQFYNLSGASFTVSGTEPQVIGLSLPVKRLDVHVQDGAGNPLANVGLSAFGPTNCLLTFGPATSCGNSFFFYSAPPPGSPPPTSGVTNAAGNLTLWLFPTPPADPSSEEPPPAYGVIATPLADSGFAQATAQGVTLTDNASLVIVLSAAPVPPVTTLEVSPAANPDGSYTAPVTFTLSATAAPGAMITATFYTLDGGEQQQYAAPFSVTAVGPHVLEYYSVDNTGLVEERQSFSFTIFDPNSTAPITTATVVPAPNANGWNNTDPTVLLTPVDTDGVALLTFAVTGAEVVPTTTVSGDLAELVLIPITTEGVSVVSFFATDALGNVEMEKTLTVRLDKTAPLVNVTVPSSTAIYGVGAVVPVSVSCTDPGGSGIASCNAPSLLDTTSAGEKTLTVVATDRADNQTTKTVTYRVGGKDDCKGSGWQLFASPMFRNQGQCVSAFVGK